VVLTADYLLTLHHEQVELELTLDALAATWTDDDGALVPRRRRTRRAPAWRQRAAG